MLPRRFFRASCPLVPSAASFTTTTCFQCCCLNFATECKLASTSVPSTVICSRRHNRFPMTSGPITDGLWLMPEGASTELVSHTWPLNLGHGEWLEEMATKYDLTVDSALRQLIFVANGEAADIKRVSPSHMLGLPRMLFVYSICEREMACSLARDVAHVHIDGHTRAAPRSCSHCRDPGIELVSAQQLWAIINCALNLLWTHHCAFLPVQTKTK